MTFDTHMAVKTLIDARASEPFAGEASTTGGSHGGRRLRELSARLGRTETAGSASGRRGFGLRPLVTVANEPAGR